MKKSDISFTNAVANIKNRVAVTKHYYEDLPKDLRTLSFTVSNLESLRQIELVKRSLQNALDEGLSFSEWKTQLNTDVLKTLSDARLETVYRTNVNVAYGQSARYNAYTSDVTPYLMYSAVGDERTREDHMKLDGVIKRADSVFWDKFTPAWDYGCRCTVIPLSTEEAKEMGITKNTPLISEEGFGPKKMGDVLSGVSKDTEKAISNLPNNSPYKTKFEEAQENIKSLVDIWYEKNKAIFE